MKLRDLARGVSFAHLMGGAARAAIATAPANAPKAETAAPKGEKDDKTEKGEGDDEPEADAAAKPEKGEGEDDDEDMRRREDDDDEDDDEDDEDDEDFAPKGEREQGVARRATRQGRARERARCASIFGSEHAAGRVELAAKLAFTTTLSAKAAVEILAASPQSAGAGDDFGRLMSTVRNPSPGPTGGPSADDKGEADRIAARIVAAGEKARPGRK